MYICASVKTFKLNKFLGEICKNLIEVPPIWRRLAPHPETSCSSSTDDRRGRKSQRGAFEKEGKKLDKRLQNSLWAKGQKTHSGLQNPIPTWQRAVTSFLYIGSSQFSARMQSKACLLSRALAASLRPRARPSAIKAWKN